MIFFTPKYISICACIYIIELLIKKLHSTGKKNKINPFPSGTNCL